MSLIIKYLCPSAEAFNPVPGPFLLGSTIASIGSNVFVGIVSVSTVNNNISLLDGCSAIVPITSAPSISDVVDTRNWLVPLAIVALPNGVNLPQLLIRLSQSGLGPIVLALTTVGPLPTASAESISCTCPFNNIIPY